MTDFQVPILTYSIASRVCNSSLLLLFAALPNPSKTALAGHTASKMTGWRLHH